MGYPSGGKYSASPAKYSRHPDHHKASDGSFWICKGGKGACGYEWNWLDKVRCHRCNHPWSGITPSTKQPAAKAESAEAWAAHATVAAVAASTKAMPAPASQADGVKPDAPPAQEDNDDTEGMEPGPRAAPEAGVLRKLFGPG